MQLDFRFELDMWGAGRCTRENHRNKNDQINICVTFQGWGWLIILKTFIATLQYKMVIRLDALWLKKYIATGLIWFHDCFLE